MVLHRLKSGVRILEYNDIEHSARFLAKGIVKCEDHYNGKSFVFDFRVAPIGICETVSMINRTPSHITYETVTECDIIDLTQVPFKKLSREINDIGKLSLFRVTSYLQLVQYKQILLRTFSAEERYLQFLKAFPSAALHCKQKDIASYLNLKQQSLSRIRENIQWNKDDKTSKIQANEILILQSKAYLKERKKTE